MFVWRCRYCLSQGAYRGAGADAIRHKFRVDVSAAAGALPDLAPGGDAASKGRMHVHALDACSMCARCLQVQCALDACWICARPACCDTDAAAAPLGQQSTSGCRCGATPSLLLTRLADAPTAGFRTLDTPTDAGATGASSDEHDDAELQRAIGQLAELALLGAGRADEMFPATLDEMYAATLDEAPFRVML